MGLALELVNILTYAGIGLIVGIVLNSKQTAALINALTGLFTQTFSVAAGTIR